MHRIPRNIVFVVAPDTTWLGSTIMRSAQLARAIESNYGNEYQVSVSSLPKTSYDKLIWAARQPSHSLLFFTKTTIQKFSQKLLDFLHLKGIVTCLDYVDMDLSISKKYRPRFHISASIQGEIILSELLANSGQDKNVRLVHHMADERLVDFCPKKQDNVRAVYFGNPGNTILTEKIRQQIVALDAGTDVRFQENMNQLKDFNLHYCIRRPVDNKGQIIAKPFTKGFTAAYCHSPVIIDRSEFDAIQLLGSDYPFVVDDISEGTILSKIDEVKKSFGERSWCEAQRRVERLKEVCSPKHVSDQILSLLDQKMGTSKNPGC